MPRSRTVKKLKPRMKDGDLSNPGVAVPNLIHHAFLQQSMMPEAAGLDVHPGLRRRLSRVRCPIITEMLRLAPVWRPYDLFNDPQRSAASAYPGIEVWDQHQVAYRERKKRPSTVQTHSRHTIIGMGCRTDLSWSARMAPTNRRASRLLASASRDAPIVPARRRLTTCWPASHCSGADDASSELQIARP